MTKPSYRYHKVHYRRVEAKAGEPTFEQLCREALEAKDSGRVANVVEIGEQRAPGM